MENCNKDVDIDIIQDTSEFQAYFATFSRYLCSRWRPNFPKIYKGFTGYLQENDILDKEIEVEVPSTRYLEWN